MVTGSYVLEIENALKEIFQKKINLIGSGRTDSGVHAQNQVANFKVDSEISPFKIKKAINSRKQALLSIGQIKEEIVESVSDSTSKGDELQKQTIAFNTINNQYTDHIFSERHVFVDTRYQQRVENVDMIEQYVSSAFSLFDIFIDG